MKNRILTTFVFLLICLSSMVITGCNLLSNNKKQESDVSKIKDNMINNLDNYSMSAKIVAQTGIVDVNIDVNCKMDNKNEIEYCKSSTLGIMEVEEYLDYKNNKIYTKTNNLVSTDEDNGKWIIKKIDNKTNSQIKNWNSLNDYLKDLEVKEQDNGKLYSGKIDIKKVQKVISSSDSNSKINVPTLSNKDIPIEIFVNKDGYIEKTNTELEILSIKENIEIKYFDFNNTGDVIIPKEAL